MKTSERILVGIGHPAHVHFYKNAVEELTARGYDTRVVTKRQPLAIELLESYGVNYEVAGRSKVQHDSVLKTGLAFASLELDMLNEVRKYRPAVVTGIANIPLSHASCIFDCESVIFTDSERAEFANRLTFPFADAILTPDGYLDDLGEKQTRYPGYHELAYLHPERFNPNLEKLREHGVDPDSNYYVLRFVALQALHDAGESGFSREAKQTLVSELSEHGIVYITGENELPERFEKYRLPVPPHLVHDLLSSANMYVGDSSTMATEAAVLGTPAIRHSTFAGDDDMGNFTQLEEKYQLLHSTPNEQQALNLVRELVTKQGVQEVWNDRRQEMLAEKTDVTDLIVNAVQQVSNE